MKKKTRTYGILLIKLLLDTVFGSNQVQQVLDSIEKLRLRRDHPVLYLVTDWLESLGKHKHHVHNPFRVGIPVHLTSGNCTFHRFQFHRKYFLRTSNRQFLRRPHLRKIRNTKQWHQVSIRRISCAEIQILSENL